MNCVIRYVLKKEYMINLRRDFHRHPELSLQERRTAGVIEQELERFEILILGSEPPVFWGFCEALKAAAES